MFIQQSLTKIVQDCGVCTLKPEQLFWVASVSFMYKREGQPSGMGPDSSDLTLFSALYRDRNHLVTVTGYV